MTGKWELGMMLLVIKLGDRFVQRSWGDTKTLWQNDRHHRITDVVYLCSARVCCSATARDWWTCLWSSSSVATACRLRPPSGTGFSTGPRLVGRTGWPRCRWRLQNRFRHRRPRRRRSPSSPRSYCCCCCSGWPPFVLQTQPPPLRSVLLIRTRHGWVPRMRRKKIIVGWWGKRYVGGWTQSSWDFDGKKKTD